MNSELKYSKNPRTFQIFWASVYFVLLCVFIFFVYQIASRIRTHIIPNGTVTLSVPYSKYALNEPISFTLTNKFNSPIYLTNNCPSEPFAVYRQEDTAWIRLHATTSEDNCPTQSRQIAVPASGTITGNFDPWNSLFSKPGKYRVVAFIEYYNSLPFQEFEIVAPPIRPQSTNSSSTDVDNDSSEAPGNTSPQASPNQNPPQNSSDPSKFKTVTTNEGLINVSYTDSYITVVSVSPAGGCTYEGGKSGSQVEVTFKCQTGETQVQLEVINGTLVSKIETGD